ncbi:hypothetical protein OAQ99_03650 [Candidatus Kapabacteria bacterium]|nr:hypothetical protein [Candidatus Kapabacteria bacterium]
MRYLTTLLIILTISCSNLKTRGSKQSPSDRMQSIGSESIISEEEENNIISKEDLLVDSLGFEKDYIASLSKRQINYLLNQYGFDENKIEELNSSIKGTNQGQERYKQIYYRDRYTDKKVINKSYELYGEQIKGGMTKFFEIAIDYYEAGNIEKSKGIFSFMKESLLEDDPLWYESSYYLGECLVNENNFKESLTVFSEILSKEDIPDFVNERSLVRAGQIHCVLGEESEAIKYFLMLRKYYPSSQYLEVADCSNI